MANRYTEEENNDMRNFKKGDVFMIDFPQGKGGFVMQGVHRGVVLYDCTFPRKTVIAAPITSLYNGSNVRKNTISTDVILPDTESYLDKESILKMEQLNCVNRSALGEKKGKLSPEYIAELELSLIEVLQLEDAIEAIIQDRLQQIVEQSEEDLA
ncbi:type II toxin-antitoxin system PemK/MazF family toxin [Vagococcus elongatus]|uniref:Growth inhibitor PemK n=1 Tax=Vagococcus elongatus TaxID=180344 RepID=A0A430AVZ6_9ENTE|nr:type II toxin-antitoxin system PemK/MazF family toxin [Vagococcus elongatus]RSU12225.1 hypothetical protein CBF29_06400 [Vagococcus elongatus]